MDRSNSQANLQAGQLITAPFLPAPAEVKKFEARPGYYRLELLLRDGSNRYLSQNISAGQLAQIQTGAIRLSSNEWKKVRHFDKRFWLYIVTMAETSQPVLHRIQNPANHFKLDEDIFATGFVIPEEKWRTRLEVKDSDAWNRTD